MTRCPVTKTEQRSSRGNALSLRVTHKHCPRLISTDRIVMVRTTWKTISRSGGGGVGTSRGRRTAPSPRWRRPCLCSFHRPSSIPCIQAVSGPAGQGRAGQGRAGQGRAGQGRAGQGRAGQGGEQEKAFGKEDAAFLAPRLALAQCLAFHFGHTDPNTSAMFVPFHSRLWRNSLHPSTSDNQHQPRQLDRGYGRVRMRLDSDRCDSCAGCVACSRECSGSDDGDEGQRGEGKDNQGLNHRYRRGWVGSGCVKHCGD